MTNERDDHHQYRTQSERQVDLCKGVESGDPGNRIVFEEGQFYLMQALDRARRGYDVLLNISTNVKFGVHEMEEV